MIIGGGVTINIDDKAADIDLKIATLKTEFEGKVKIELDTSNNIIYYHQVVSGL